MSKRVLITGASGFVGSNLVPFLLDEQGYLPIKVSRSQIQSDGDAISYEHLFTKYNNSEIYSYIHLAGKAHDLKKASDESAYFKVNYELTKRLYDHFLKEEKAKLFVFMSSVKAVADEVQGKLTEDQYPNPVTAYGRSKLKAENYILDNLPEGRTVIILRPCMIHGPGNKGNLNLLFTVVNNGIPWLLGSYENYRSFLSIDNLCFVIKEILKGKIPSGVYNVADDESLSTNEVVSTIAKVCNKRYRIWKVPKWLIKPLAKVGNFLPLPLNEERLGKLTESYVVSNQKIKRALGIDALPVEAKKGLIKTIQSLKSQ